MVGSGSCIFANIDDYEAGLPFQVDLVAPQPDQFRAHLTWMELPNIRLMHAREMPQRIAYVCLPSDQVFLTFPIHRTASLVYGDVCMQWGDVVLHSPGERFHQRTAGSSSWGTIAIALSTLMTYGRILGGYDFAIPSSCGVRRLYIADEKELLRLHRHAARLAETSLDRLVRPEIVRALENDLIVALVSCLANGEVRNGSTTSRCQTAMLVQFEDVLATSLHNVPRISQICHAIGVSERVLQACCAQVLGISATHYVHLRWLKQARRTYVR